ncbi:MAG: divalent-cation tolerance protein CutA [Myxococcaceae bacterium]|jgi:periplasmic divalent cation tolerance protein|nr:divalent-cation tolerance protein CutA [Myxococcaceae bacterium]
MASRRRPRTPTPKKKASDGEVVLVLSTAPSEEVAASLARTLVDERLIACANLVPQARSIYRWQGAVQDEAEVLVLMKTQRARLAALEARLKALHPYQVPEMLVFPAASGHGPYLAWVLAETTPPKGV